MALGRWGATAFLLILWVSLLTNDADGAASEKIGVGKEPLPDNKNDEVPAPPPDLFDFGNADFGEVEPEASRSAPDPHWELTRNTSSSGDEGESAKFAFGQLCSKRAEGGIAEDICVAYFPDLYELSHETCAEAPDSEWMELALLAGFDYTGCTALPQAVPRTRKIRDPKDREVEEFIVDDESKPVAGKIVSLLFAGDCPIETRVDNVLAVDGKGVLLLSRNNTVPELSVPETKFKIPVLAIGANTYQRTEALPPGTKFRPFTSTRFEFQPGLVLIWVLSLFTIAVGAYWSGTTRYRLYHQRQGGMDSQVVNILSSRTSQHRSSLSESLTSQDGSTAGQRSGAKHHEEPHMSVPILGVLAIVGAMCGMLVLLYFYMEVLIWIIITMYTLACTSALFHCFNSLMKKAPFCDCMMPCQSNYLKCQVRQVVLFFVCCATTIVWVVYRNEDWAWGLQDFLGVCFCINMLRLLRLSSVRIIAFFLCLLLIYDVFFVFITPYFTGNGRSIMVEVAVGGSDNVIEGRPAEQLPLLLKVPSFTPNPCRESGHYNMLGLGDILIPGLIPAYGFAFDLQKNTPGRCFYFVLTMCAYAVGLLVTFGALFAMSEAQPALLYLVPFTLASILIGAAFRGEFSSIWTGDAWTEEGDPLSSPGTVTSPSSKEGRSTPRRQEEGLSADEESRGDGQAS